MLEDRLVSKRVESLKTIGFDIASGSPASGGNQDEIHHHHLYDTSNNNWSKEGNNNGNEEENDESKPRLSNKKKFVMRFKELCEFQRKYGHTNPHRGEFQTLSYWVQRQRQLYSQDKLKPERRAMLDSIVSI